MATRWARRLTLAPVAALGLYAVSLGLPLPDSCVASAAPSPSCSGDLRECLSASAHQDRYARWVTAEDVARCMEAFRSCINGGASRGGNPGAPPTTSTRRDNGTGLPQRFGIKAPYFDYDCTRSGETVACTGTGNLSEGVDSHTAEVTGTLSGLTMTGSLTGHLTGHGANPSCRVEHEWTGPITYVFNPDGAVTMRNGPFQLNRTYSSCYDPGFSKSEVTEALEETASWSAIG